MLPRARRLYSLHKTGWGERGRIERELKLRNSKVSALLLFLSRKKPQSRVSAASIRRCPAKRRMQKRIWLKPGCFLVSESPRHSLQNLKRSCLPLPTPANPSPPGLHFSRRGIQIKAFSPHRPRSERKVKRLAVEGPQPPSLATLPAAMPGRSRRCSWCGAGPQPAARPASRCAGPGAAGGVHLLACHHLLAKMVRSHTQRRPAGERELNLFPTGFQRAATAQAAQRGAPHKGSASGGT